MRPSPGRSPAEHERRAVPGVRQRTVAHGRQPAPQVLHFVPAFQVTAATDRAGCSCGPARRLAPHSRRASAAHAPGCRASTGRALFRPGTDRAPTMLAVPPLSKCPDVFRRALSEFWKHPPRRTALDTRAATEVPEHLLHFRRQSVQEAATAVLANGANAFGLPQQPASGTALHENQTIPLVFEDGLMPDVKVVPKQLGQLRSAEGLGQARLGDLEVADDVQSRLAMKIPTLQTRVEHEQVALFEPPQRTLEASWISVCIALKLWIEVDGLVVHSRAEVRRKVRNQPLPFSRQRVPVCSFINTPTTEAVRDWDVLERTVVEQRAVDATRPSVYSNPQ